MESLKKEKPTKFSLDGLLFMPATIYSPTHFRVQYNSDDTMPTVLRSGPYRFYFYSHEPNEPPHLHVDRDDLSAKFWLEPVGLARNFGFSAHEINTLQSLVQANQQEFLEAWNGYFGHRGR